MSQPAAIDQLSSADTADTAGAIMLGVGGAALTAGVVLIVLDVLGDDGTSNMAIVPTGRGFAVTGRF